MGPLLSDLKSESTCTNATIHFKGAVKTGGVSPSPVFVGSRVGQWQDSGWTGLGRQRPPSLRWTDKFRD